MSQEKLNTICDLQAKALITNENQQLVPFAFSLQSPYATDSTIVIYDKILLYYHISLYHLTPYFIKRYYLQLLAIDWESRRSAFKAIPKWILR